VLKASAVFYLHSADIFLYQKQSGRCFMRVSVAADTEDSTFTGRDKCDFGSFLVGVQTPTE